MYKLLGEDNKQHAIYARSVLVALHSVLQIAST